MQYIGTITVKNKNGKLFTLKSGSLEPCTETHIKNHDQNFFIPITVNIITVANLCHYMFDIELNNLKIYLENCLIPSVNINSIIGQNDVRIECGSGSININAVPLRSLLYYLISPSTPYIPSELPKNIETLSYRLYTPNDNVTIDIETMYLLFHMGEQLRAMTLSTKTETKVKITNGIDGFNPLTHDNNCITLFFDDRVFIISSTGYILAKSDQKDDLKFINDIIILNDFSNVETTWSYACDTNMMAVFVVDSNEVKIPDEIINMLNMVLHFETMTSVKWKIFNLYRLFRTDYSENDHLTNNPSLHIISHNLDNHVHILLSNMPSIKDVLMLYNLIKNWKPIIEVNESMQKISSLFQLHTLRQFDNILFGKRVVEGKITSYSSLCQGTEHRPIIIDNPEEYKDRKILQFNSYITPKNKVCLACIDDEYKNIGFHIIKDQLPIIRCVKNQNNDLSNVHDVSDMFEVLNALAGKYSITANKSIAINYSDSIAANRVMKLPTFVNYTAGYCMFLEKSAMEIAKEKKVNTYVVNNDGIGYIELDPKLGTTIMYHVHDKTLIINKTKTELFTIEKGSNIESFMKTFVTKSRIELKEFIESELYVKSISEEYVDPWTGYSSYSKFENGKILSIIEHLPLSGVKQIYDVPKVTGLTTDYKRYKYTIVFDDEINIIYKNEFFPTADSVKKIKHKQVNIESIIQSIIYFHFYNINPNRKHKGERKYHPLSSETFISYESNDMKIKELPVQFRVISRNIIKNMSINSTVEHEFVI